MTNHTFVAFESPHRIEMFLREAGEKLVERPLCVAREMTKAHQEFLHGTAEALALRGANARGEFTIVIGPPDAGEKSPLELPQKEILLAEFGQLTEVEALGRREAVARLARRYGRSSRELYAAIEAAKDPVS
jgi:16S rRNA (cytidine1402-2'-O)-methyltransferase